MDVKEREVREKIAEASYKTHAEWREVMDAMRIRLREQMSEELKEVIK